MLVSCAVVENNIITNMIAIDDGNIESFSKDLGKELVYEPTISLAIGDERVDNEWVRIINDVPTILMRTE